MSKHIYDHICPACGKKYDETVHAAVIAAYELPCSETCAERLWALEQWLIHRGYRR